MGGKALPTETTTPVPEFWKSGVAEVRQAVSGLKNGSVQVLATSPGRRQLYLVAYGDREQVGSSANYSSACGARDLAAYRAKDGRQKPVVLFLGPVHGQELEGVVGLLNLLSVAETSRDLRGRGWPRLIENLRQCRVLIVPLGNPDGRARCPMDSWIGVQQDIHERIGMGTTPEGQNYHWPTVKRFHPMRGSKVGQLGCYFNDNGINLMHDEWFDPMAAETRAFLKLALAEAPDFAVSLHSHGVEPSVEPTAYVPRTIKETIRQFSERLFKRYAAAGLPHQPPTEVAEDGTVFPPPSFNLASALHHTCGGVSFVHETPAGIKPELPLTHENVLDIEMLLYEELLNFALEHRTRWT
jgi:hypothetical protein